ncbi:hypothetical protein [Micromonospora ureilytica]|uniref:hypothetical protein n=1 Tax=Micromonospora ureilytica TaxID=709868 RepID=UPI004038FEC8
MAAMLCEGDAGDCRSAAADSTSKSHHSMTPQPILQLSKVTWPDESSSPCGQVGNPIGEESCLRTIRPNEHAPDDRCPIAERTGTGVGQILDPISAAIA